MIIKFKHKIVSDNQRTIPTIVNGHPRQVPSNEYKKCKDELIKWMKFETPPYHKPFNNNIVIRGKVWTYKDITNILKILCDALEGAGIIENDRQITKCIIEKIPIKRGEIDSVEIGITGGYR